MASRTLSLVDDITQLIDNTIQIIINNNYITSDVNISRTNTFIKGNTTNIEQESIDDISDCTNCGLPSPSHHSIIYYAEVPGDIVALESPEIASEEDDIAVSIYNTPKSAREVKNGAGRNRSDTDIVESSRQARNDSQLRFVHAGDYDGSNILLGEVDAIQVCSTNGYRVSAKTQITPRDIHLTSHLGDGKDNSIISKTDSTQTFSNEIAIRDYATLTISNSTSHHSSDSVHTLENISKPPSREVMVVDATPGKDLAVVDDELEIVDLPTFNPETNEVSDTKITDKASEVVDEVGDGKEKPSSNERVLFYHFYEPRIPVYNSRYGKYRYKYQMLPHNCTPPQELGFDSVESFNNSLNSKSEIIIKPPVTIGRTVSFRSHIGKSVLARNNFVENTIFQIDYTHKRRKKLWNNCCRV